MSLEDKAKKAFVAESRKDPRSFMTVESLTGAGLYIQKILGFYDYNRGYYEGYKQAIKDLLEKADKFPVNVASSSEDYRRGAFDGHKEWTKQLLQAAEDLLKEK